MKTLSASLAAFAILLAACSSAENQSTEGDLYTKLTIT